MDYTIYLAVSFISWTLDKKDAAEINVLLKSYQSSSE
jgi:hypothetical protein